MRRALTLIGLALAGLLAILWFAGALDGLARGLATVQRGVQNELAAAIDLTRTGRSAWRFFMIAALAFLVLESLFADRLLKRGPSKQENSASPEPQNA